MMNKDILICGVGGQGTVLASKIIAASAMADGNMVHSAETIGMAQRGGPVTSHVRIGDDAYSPLIPFGKADVILGFEPSEVVRNLKYLASDGLAVVNTCAVKPVTESLAHSGYDGSEMVEYLKKNVRCIFVNGEEECRKLGSVKFLNIFLLGVAAGAGYKETSIDGEDFKPFKDAAGSTDTESGSGLGISKEIILDQIEKRVPEKFREVNKQAFLMGFDIGAAQFDH